MDTATLEHLGLHHLMERTDTPNGRSNADITQQLDTPGDAPYHPCAEAYLTTEVPRGEVTELLDWAGSAIYPGMKRDIALYAPAQLSAATKSPGVIVFNDGFGYQDPDGAVRATAVLDTLIHRGQIPVTAAVFVMPGRPLDFPSAREERPNPPANPRKRNLDQRSLEYDSLTDDYPRFLVDELLPLAEQQLGVTFTNDPTQRTVCGISSGGIAAFNAAWHRPESFGAVISHCGSFTSINGGHNYPVLVRTTERKPIKVWMQSGANDADIPWGNWQLANQQMAGALAYAGYEVHFDFGTGSHNLRHGGALFTDTLTWLLGAPPPER